MKNSKQKIINLGKQKSEDILFCYLRVSTKKQKTEGLSLEQQAKIGKQVAKNLGLKYFELNEGATSSRDKIEYNQERDETTFFGQIEKAIIQGKIKNLWYNDRKRFARSGIEDMYFQALFRKHKVNIFETKSGNQRKFDTAQDRGIDSILGIVGQIDRDDRREKSIGGKIYKSEKYGDTKQVHLGGTLFGFDVQQDKDKIKVYVKNKENQKHLQKMFDLYSKGKSIKDIKNYLESNNVKTSIGNTKWSLGSIQKILQNEKYIGNYQWFDKDSQRTFNMFLERSISISVFNKVQRMFKKNQKNKGSNVRKHDSLFGQYLRCNCGESITSYYQKRTSVLKGEYFTKTYYCLSKHNQWKGKLVKVCNNRRSLDMDKTDEFLLEQIKDVLTKSHKFKEEYKKTILGQKAKYNNEVKSQKEMIEKRVDYYDREKSRIYDSIAKTYTDSVLKNDTSLKNKIIKNLQDEVEKIEHKKSENLEQLKNIDEMQGWVNWIEQCGKSIQERTSDRGKSKLLLDEIIDEIIVYEVMGESRGKKIQIGHKFDIKFKMAIVNDKLIYADEKLKSKGYDLKSGRKTLKIGLSRDLGTSQIRKDNRADSKVKKSVGIG